MLKVRTDSDSLFWIPTEAVNWFRERLKTNASFRISCFLSMIIFGTVSFRILELEGYTTDWLDEWENKDLAIHD